MPAPPSSLALTPAFLAATAIRPASSIGPSRGPSGTFYLDDHSLQVGHLLERAMAAYSPDAAALAGPAAEWDVRLPIVGGLIDVDPADLEALGHAQRARKIARVDGAEQAIWRVVGDGQRLGLVLELDDRRDRPEGLLAAHEHLRRDAVEDGGGVVEAGREAFGAPAAQHQPRAAVERVGDVVVHLGGDALVVERSERRVRRERVAEAQLLRCR